MVTYSDIMRAPLASLAREALDESAEFGKRLVCWNGLAARVREFSGAGWLLFEPADRHVITRALALDMTALACAEFGLNFPAARAA